MKTFVAVFLSKYLTRFLVITKLLAQINVFRKVEVRFWVMYFIQGTPHLRELVLN